MFAENTQSSTQSTPTDVAVKKEGDAALLNLKPIEQLSENFAIDADIGHGEDSRAGRGEN